MCGDIIFLIELLKKNKFKNLLIIVQIVISVFYLTFFLIPITEAIDTDILMKKLNMKNDIAFFDEAQHISFLPENYNNDRYEELKNIMKNINNVEEVGSVYTIVGSERNLYGMIIYDQLVYNTIKLDLKEGKWFDNSDIDKEIIPVVISNKLGDTYKINSVFSTNVFLDENMTVKEELTFKVIGILKNKTYVYTGGANHSDCSIADLFIKTTPNDEIVIMPNIFEKMPLYWANNGMIIKTNDYIETYKSIKEKGIGKISSLEDISKNNINNITEYINNKSSEGVRVIIFSAKAALYMIPLKESNGYYDLPFYGNYGNLTEMEIIEEFKNKENVEILLQKDEENMEWQESKQINRNLKKELKKVGEIEEFEIYVNN